jgi:hypothetical protein
MLIPEPNLQRPRLIATPGSWAEVHALRGTDRRYDAFLQRIEQDSLALLEAPVCTYEKTGRRLLDVSRLVLRRVLGLSLTYRLTENPAFLRRAEAEMLSAANFADWNPSHFLDTAEMMAGLAFGYDWLHADLSPEARDAVREALIRKGLQEIWPDGKTRGFVDASHNWNQVCFAGAALAALAVWDEAPELARRTMELVPENNKRGQAPYAPAGVYPEGPMYWSYGTSFEVVLLSALRRAFGVDFGLSDAPGFMQTAAVQVQHTAPSGAWFNFSDCSLCGGLEPALFWFARELNQPELLHFQWEKLDAWSSPQPPADAYRGESRLVPLAALWWPHSLEARSELPLSYYGEGENPVVILRSSWTERDATFLALKGGRANLGHAHMDAGTFVYEARGVRWVHDLGMQDYHSLESIGINLWDRSQDGDRWSIFRLGPFSHNTLTIDGRRHNVGGQGSITARLDAGEEKIAAVDLTPVFAGQAETAQRTFRVKGASVRITDALTGLAPGSSVRWAMVTRADVTIDGLVASLRESGKELWLSFECDAEIRVASSPAVGPNAYDAPNPGFFILTATVTAPPSGSVELHATLGPTRVEVM